MLEQNHKIKDWRIDIKKAVSKDTSQANQGYSGNRDDGRSFGGGYGNFGRGYGERGRGGGPAPWNSGAMGQSFSNDGFGGGWAGGMSSNMGCDMGGGMGDGMGGGMRNDMDGPMGGGMGSMNTAGMGGGMANMGGSMSNMGNQSIGMQKTEPPPSIGHPSSSIASVAAHSINSNEDFISCH